VGEAVTQIQSCACERCSLSNHFDRVLKGVGHRGSSFSDLDAVTHDGTTGRFLVQEFKYYESPAVPYAQHWMLQGFAAIPAHFTVWIIVYRDEKTIDFVEIPRDFSHRGFCTITVAEYRERFRCWWEQRPLVLKQPALRPTVAEIKW